MSERAAYSRVYWSIIDDPKFTTIYDSDTHLAAWLRLLLIADQAYPASAHIPAGARKASVLALADAELIDLMPGGRYRIHGLDAERDRRRLAATTRGPNGTRTVTERYPDGIQTRGLRRDETRRDEKEPPNPPRGGGRRSDGTNQRALAAKEREAELERAARSRRERTQVTVHENGGHVETPSLECPRCRVREAVAS